MLDSVQSTAQSLEREVLEYVPALERRVAIPCCNASSPPGLVEAVTVDPWSKSGKYALAWVYFSIILLVFVTALRWYHFWHDKMRTALQKEKTERAAIEAATMITPDTDYELSGLSSSQSTKKFFPKEGPLPGQPREEQQVQSSSTSWPLNYLIGAFRYIFYRPIPSIHYRKGWRPVILPALGVIVVVFLAVALVICYTFVPQPLYWQSIRFGSPPVAIRSGMLAVAMMPWVVALSMKANFISILTGIGHERLNVLHRWAAYICLLLSLIHTVPFYITPIWDKGGYAVFKSFFANQHFYVYGTGTHIMHTQERLYADNYRRCGISTADIPLRPFSATAEKKILRALRYGPCAGIDRLIGNAVLALPQLPDLLELSLGNYGDLADLIPRSIVLPQLDESFPNFVLHWRGSGSYIASRECRQSHGPNPSQMEAWTIRVPSNAWYLCFRKPSIYHCLALQ